MRIRQATTKDRGEVAKLIKTYPTRLIQIHLPKISNFFVAVEGGEVVGCCALEIYSKRLAEIRSLAVAKKYQGRGIATKLIRHCLKQARAKGVYEILGITSAVKLFNRLGFKTFNRERFALLKILK